MRAVTSLSATILLAILTTHPLCACAGIGVVETGNPDQKLRDAETLFSQKDRPLIAERLIREALATSEQQNDKLGIANAYRTYGFFFRSSSVSGNWAEYYRKHGFLEPAVTWPTRLDGSIRFFQKAAEIYDGLSRYDASTNVYLNMGHTYTLMQDTEHACAAWSKALDSYHANLRVNPNARPQTPPGFPSFEDFVNSLRAHESCPKNDGSRA
jgi:tetratricopeptide (TPR) repeat protein